MREVYPWRDEHSSGRLGHTEIPEDRQECNTKSSACRVTGYDNLLGLHRFVRSIRWWAC